MRFNSGDSIPSKFASHDHRMNSKVSLSFLAVNPVCTSAFSSSYQYNEAHITEYVIWAWIPVWIDHKVIRKLAKWMNRAVTHTSQVHPALLSADIVIEVAQLPGTPKLLMKVWLAVVLSGSTFYTLVIWPMGRIYVWPLTYGDQQTDVWKNSGIWSHADRRSLFCLM